MWPYWLLFIIVAFAALGTRQQVAALIDARHMPVITPGGVTLLVVLTLMIGLRFQVGGDWVAYKAYLDESRGMTFLDALTMSDPGYWLVNVLATSTGWEIAGVNIICGFIFSLGLILFSQTLPRPWLALLIAVPYLVIVVGMGYSRQSVALGFIMMGLAAFSRQRPMLYIALCLMAAIFHMTSIIMIPVAALVYTRNRVFVIGLVGVISVAAYFTLLQDNVNDLVQQYITREYQSTGALIRLAQNALPAAMFLYFRQSFQMPIHIKRYFTLIAMGCLGLFALFFITSASTALDRMALYFIPMQMVVFSHLADNLMPKPQGRQATLIAIVLYAGLLLLNWLLFATHSGAWLPYQTLFNVWI